MNRLTTTRRFLFHVPKKKGGGNIEKYKSRNHLVELYLDSDEWMSAYNNLLMLDNVSYIHHNQDGCKEHVHAVVICDNPTYNTALANKLGIDVKWIQKIKCRDSAFRYLIHKDNEDKHLYDESEVMHTSKIMQELFETAVNKDEKESEDMKVLRLLSLLDNYGVLTYSDFIKVCCKNNLYDVVRRNNYLMCRLLNEHNERMIE